LETPKVFAVIVWYNGLKWVDKCLESLKSSNCQLTTVVVDNGSTDGSVEKIKANFPEVVLIESGLNLGFGKANNIGMEYALEREADYVFLLNQDAWIKNDNTIADLINVSSRHEEYGIVSPIHLNGTNTGLDLNFSRNIGPKSCPGFYSDLYIKNLKDIYPVQNINAAAWLITKKCLQTVGLFERAFHLYGEDDNYIQRLRFHKLQLGLVPSAEICHDREERKGLPNSVGIKRKIPTNKLTLILNINNSYLKSYAYVIQYALYLLFKGFILKSLSVIFDPIFRFPYYSKIRSRHKLIWKR
jgi:GT2 family glycosyltransferase